MKTLFTLLLAFLSASLFATTIHYDLRMTEPHTHYFEVIMKIGEVADKEYVDITMPIWAPGSYLIREFGKSVEAITAEDSNRETLKWEQLDKNTWRVYSNKRENFTFNYKVYAFEMSVRTSFLDDRHGYINGTSVFMLVEGAKDVEHTLTIYPHENFKTITTALEKTGENSYKSPDYDILADAPIEMGSHIMYEYDVDGVPHYVAMFGDGNYDMEALLPDMQKITKECVDVFGSNPNKEYTFIVHNQTERGGGLEHLSSTTLQVNRWTYGSRKGLQSYISLVAHEYFHLWNVKRIRPAALGPFDYSNENYTKLLYVSEGVTSYYDQLLLRRADFYTEEEYIKQLANEITYVENQPGNKVQPVSESSFNAWIRAYRRTENHPNTNISYYSKGSLIALVLDLEIRKTSNGEKSLDDLMRRLYNEYHIKQQRGFTSEEFEKEVSTIIGRDMTEFFNLYVHGTTTLPYNDYFNYVGMELVDLNKEQKVMFGASIREDNGIFTVSRVMRGTSAYASGINVHDEIIAIDGYRLKSDNKSKLMDDKKVGDVMKVTISRDNRIRTIEVKMIGTTRHDFELVELPKMDKMQKKLHAGWLDLD